MGVAQPPDDMECTCLLETHEVSLGVEGLEEITETDFRGLFKEKFVLVDSRRKYRAKFF